MDTNKQEVDFNFDYVITFCHLNCNNTPTSLFKCSPKRFRCQHLSQV